MGQVARSAQAGNKGSLFRRFRSQAMVDGRDFNPHSCERRSLCKQMQQCNRIPAAGYRYADSQRPGQRLIASIQTDCSTQKLAVRFRLAINPKRKPLCVYWHPKPCIATVACVAAMLVGKRDPTSARVTQASCTWPSAPSPSPSFNSASGAIGPSGLAENASR